LRFIKPPPECFIEPLADFALTSGLRVRPNDRVGEFGFIMPSGGLAFHAGGRIRFHTVSGLAPFGT
jgi:hypothetical protein